MRVCVFASSSPRTPERYLAVAAAFGQAAAERGWTVICGAGEDGGMGAVTDAALAVGGTVDGVILQKFLDEDLVHPRLSSLVSTTTMRERKRLLGDQADAFVVLPGGPGTWEEFWEVAVERQINTHTKPVIVVNADDYYAGFVQQAERAARDGMLYGEISELFTVVSDAAAAIAKLTG